MVSVTESLLRVLLTHCGAEHVVSEVDIMVLDPERRAVRCAERRTVDAAAVDRNGDLQARDRRGKNVRQRVSRCLQHQMALTGKAKKPTAKSSGPRS